MKRIEKIVGVVMLGFLLLPAVLQPQGDGAPAGPVLSLEEVIQKLQNNYQSIVTYAVDFDQELVSLSQDRVISKGEGSVMYKKPGKMVWHYKTPEEHYYITDGNTLYDYAPAEKEVYILPMREATIKTFLLGLGDVKKDFEVTFREGKPMTPSGLYQLDLTPRNPADRETFGSITLYLNPQIDYMVQFTSMIDAFGNQNRLRFKNMRVNIPLDDSLFKFTPPPGVKVVNAKDLDKEP